VIVGAGPYGLAVAAHLLDRGVRPRVLGDPMSSWRDQMPVGMFLKSTPRASSISAPHPGATLGDFCATIGEAGLVGHHPVPIDTFIGYGCWFQERLVPEVERTRVLRVGQAAGGFAVELESGEEVATRAVVIATGAAPYAYVPPQLATLASEDPARIGAVSHASQHRDLTRFAGRHVAVIGAGQSALETAALLHEGGAEVRVLVRETEVVFPPPPEDLEHQTGSLRYPDSPLGAGLTLYACTHGAGQFRRLPLRTRLRLVARVLGPAGAWWLRDRVDGVIPIELGARVESASTVDGEVVLRVATQNGTQSITVDNVIAGTGYRVNVDSLDLLTPELRASLARRDTWPWLSGSFESSVRGLFFTGLASAAMFGPLMRFVCGTVFAAPRVSAALAR
jgi:cation diffusion facilitator CzcD-associated flavoprotein CzcO